MAGIKVTDWLGIEMGMDASSISPARWTMGWTGLRFTGREGPGALDLEIGLGGGAGGSYCEDSEECGEEPVVPWYRRAAFGGYLGYGLGVHKRWFSLFVRSRWQLSRARNVPTTLWATVIGGLQVTLFRFLHVHFGAGYGGYWNDMDTKQFPLLDMGISISFKPSRFGSSG